MTVLPNEIEVSYDIATKQRIDKKWLIHVRAYIKNNSTQTIHINKRILTLCEVVYIDGTKETPNKHFINKPNHKIPQGRTATGESEITGAILEPIKMKFKLELFISELPTIFVAEFESINLFRGKKDLRILKISSDKITKAIEEAKRQGKNGFYMFYDTDTKGRIIKIGYSFELPDMNWIYADECQVEIINGEKIVIADEDFISDLIVTYHLPEKPDEKQTTIIRGIVYNYKKWLKGRRN